VGIYEDQQPYIITVNGEAKAVLQDVRSYEMMQEQLAMLTIVIQGQQDIAEGKVVPLDEAMSNIQRKYAKNTSRKA
jgi:PHD/YefM family antitoxin component YafN of YafNO toxin-antitoxin module